MLTLLKAAIGLKYGEWRMEEATQNISQSPLSSSSPPAQPLTFPPQSSASDAPISSSSPGWICRSGARSSPIESIRESLVKQEHAALLDRVETVHARSASRCSSGAYNNGLTVPSIAEGPVGSVSVRLLRTVHRTRYRGLPKRRHDPATAPRSAQRRSVPYKTSATAAAYPNVRLEAEHFDSEWRWLGSYGSWRSALFIFMYPENLLYPTLRAKTEQSEVFQSIVRESQALSQSPMLMRTPTKPRLFLDPFIRATCFARIPYVASSAAEFGRRNSDEKVEMGRACAIDRVSNPKRWRMPVTRMMLEVESEYQCVRRGFSQLLDKLRQRRNRRSLMRSICSSRRRRLWSGGGACDDFRRWISMRRRRPIDRVPAQRRRLLAGPVSIKRTLYRVAGKCWTVDAVCGPEQCDAGCRDGGGDGDRECQRAPSRRRKSSERWQRLPYSRCAFEHLVGKQYGKRGRKWSAPWLRRWRFPTVRTPSVYLNRVSIPMEEPREEGQRKSERSPKRGVRKVPKSPQRSPKGPKRKGKDALRSTRISHGVCGDRDVARCDGEGPSHPAIWPDAATSMACAQAMMCWRSFRAVRSLLVVLLCDGARSYGIGWARNLTSPVWGVRSIVWSICGTCWKSSECGQGAVWRRRSFRAARQVAAESAQRRQRGGADSQDACGQSKRVPCASATVAPCARSHHLP